MVLPLLANEVVTTGWVTETDFLTGFALVQAMPGPLFNFAAYLGAPLVKQAHTNRCTRHKLSLDVLIGGTCKAAGTSQRVPKNVMVELSHGFRTHFLLRGQ